MMMVQEEVVVGISIHNWHVRIERTTSLGSRAVLSIGLGIRVTTGRAASHCTRGSRFARCHSTFCGTPAWLGLFPLA